MGTKYVEAARLEFDKLYERSGPSTPVFFILSPGLDPLKDVEKLGTAFCLFVFIFTVYITWRVTFYILILSRIEAGIFH